MNFDKNNIKDNKLILRITGLFIGLVGMGFFLSLLMMINFGVDPCSSTSLGISSKTGLSFGTCQLLLNMIMLIVVAIWKWRMIGLGTIGNMVCIGYINDFFTWIWKSSFDNYSHLSMTIRLVVLIIGLAGFVVSAALYMSVNLGVSAYDALPMLISTKVKKIPFRFLRILWDFIFAVIAFSLGSKIGLVTIGMVLLLGPVISKVGNYLAKNIFKTQMTGTDK